MSRVFEGSTERALAGTAGQYSFWVYFEPLGNPSFHFCHKTDFEVVLQIKDLRILEVKKSEGRFSFKKGDALPKSLQGVVEGFLSQTSQKNPKLTNREVIALLWDSLNP
jgi:hypothetical protein